MPTPVLIAVSSSWLVVSTITLGELSTERVVVGSVGGMLVALCTLLIKALQTQQKAMGITLKEQRESSDAAIKQWQALALNATTSAAANLAFNNESWQRRHDDAKRDWESKMHDLRLEVNDLQSQVDLLQRRRYPFRSDTVSSSYDTPSAHVAPAFPATVIHPPAFPPDTQE